MIDETVRTLRVHCLRRWMRIAGVNYDDVARKLGVNSRTVRNWEKRGLPKIARLAFAAAFLTKPTPSGTVHARRGTTIGGLTWIRRLASSGSKPTL
jgi:transcriptional regulator with XRE-family HTH domain